MNFTKYQSYPPVPLPDRQWPNNPITKAPRWCSVDLRDGNQALEIPMTLEQKLAFFEFLVRRGFKEIEIGFPAASDTEFIFTRALIERGLIPDDVTIQVLTQSRGPIIEKTFEAVAGAKHVIVHLYNSTSTLQRDVVFGKSKEEIRELAVYGAKLFAELSERYGRERFVFEYSPESFTGTELDYAVEVCDAVVDVWKPTAERKVIVNLPSTVEMATPNIYADQIEYMCTNLKNRENIIISLHAHNDRGTAVAATELAMMAGADRVEGTLFGNGERTGNADILVLAMNLFSQGIDPKLDFSRIDDSVCIYEKSTGLSVHPRHPYAGSLVYTAFSGSHQDAIKKGMAKMEERPGLWAVPYLPVDPLDVGRSYDPIVRINSQSGKGGVAFVLEKSFGLQIPKRMQPDVGNTVTGVSDQKKKDLSPEEIYDIFKAAYVNLSSPISLLGYTEKQNGETIMLEAGILMDGEEKRFSAEGNGLIDAFCNGLSELLHIRHFDIENYSEHSMEYGSQSRAITYVEIMDGNGDSYFGAGVSSNISKSSLRAVVSAVNKMLLG